MRITRAWIFLVALSAGSTVIAVSGQTGLAISLAILLLAWAKALIIVRSYLGLAEAPAWGRGFAMVLGGYMLLAMALVVMAGPV
ncbi:cytochrome C oxidase subunit IV family protein [Marimonas lutisalis]|uniref:cytochrome C oxidase subunit IV family protein n=1 Tax=Marimonas lutisalis TaxID=2545756 RepID=UPI0010F9113C|nr:cytochrome C oxidase subunit IV family protein [Marimonas lutisalis]